MAPSRLRAERSKGFTLVELLVVIGIIALLISVLLPSLSRARQSAIAIQCASNLRQMHSFYEAYAKEQRGYYPAPWFGLGQTEGDPPRWRNTWALQWPYLIWPYARPRPMPYGLGVSGGPLGHYNNPGFAGNGGDWGLFGGIYKPNVDRAPAFFCPATIQAGLGFNGDTNNPSQNPADWITTYSMTQAARSQRGHNPFSATDTGYNLWGYPKPTRTRNAATKLLLVDMAGDYGQRTNPNMFRRMTAFIGVSDTLDANGNPQIAGWINPHNKRSNMLFYDGHVESLVERDLKIPMFRLDR